MLSIIGLVLGISLFVYAAYKKVNIILASLMACAVMAVFSGMSVYDMAIGPYMDGASDFLKSYFLMMLFSAVLGRLMSDGKGAKKIAMTVGKLVEHSSPQRQKFASVLLVVGLYYVFSYIGISGFVLVFTIMPIAMHLFRSTDTPWRFYCFGGVQISSSAMLAASLNYPNIYAGDICGTPTTAGLGLSIVATVLWLACTMVLILLFLRSAEKHHETFLTDGAAVLEATKANTNDPNEVLPSLPASLFPLALVMVCTAVFHVDITKALVFGCIAAVITLFPQLRKNLMGSLSQGTVDCYGSALTVAALYGFGSVVKQIPAFAMFTDGLSVLPALAQGSILSAVAAFIIAGSPVPVFGKQILDCYTAANIPPALAHRLMTITGWTSIAPHNAGLTNSSSVTRINYGRCLKIYLTAAYVPGIIVTVVSHLLVLAGFFH